MKAIAVLFLLVLGLFFPLHLFSETSITQAVPHNVTNAKVIVIPIEGDIEEGLTYFLKRAVADAVAKKPDHIVFKVNTFGGRLDAAFEIVDLLLEIKCCTTTVFVEQKAISAGALISLAASQIAMANGTTIGDCAPIIQGQQGIVMAGEKIESPLRAKFRNLAEKHGYPKLLAQAMVSLDMEVMRVKKDGKWEYFTPKQWDNLSKQQQSTYTDKQTVDHDGELLTMTDIEAKEYGFSIGSFATLEDFLKYKNWTVIESIQSNWSEELVRLIGKWAPILMLLGFGALYMEFKTPGLGFFGLIGIVLLGIVFGSKYASGLANHTELLLLLLGVALFLVEIFIMPGTYIFGIAGVAALATALILSMQGFTIPDPTMPWQKEILLNNLLVVIGGASVSILIPIFTARYLLPYIPGHNKLIPETTLELAKSYTLLETHPDLCIGNVGIALTDLRPYGKIQIGNGAGIEAQAINGYMQRGSTVVVEKIQSNYVLVCEENGDA